MGEGGGGAEEGSHLCWSLPQVEDGKGGRGSQRGAGPIGRGPRTPDRWQSRQDQLCASSILLCACKHTVWVRSV